MTNYPLFSLDSEHVFRKINVKTCLCFEKEDILTHKLGLNFVVETPNGVSLSFTRQAAEELAEDLVRLLKMISNFAS